MSGSRLRRLHHIVRLAEPGKRYRAWLVQIQRHGRITTGHFRDTLYGGKQMALKAAIRFRDALLGDVEEQRYWVARRDRARRDNTSGIIGVGRYISRERKGRKIVERHAWHARWTDLNGRRHLRRFAVEHYGERGAKALACRARAAAMRVLRKSIAKRDSLPKSAR